MRTTLSVDNDVLERARSVAAKLGTPFKTVVNEALRAGLDHVEKPTKQRRYLYAAGHFPRAKLAGSALHSNGKAHRAALDNLQRNAHGGTGPCQPCYGSHMAALAIEHGCKLASTDSDFARFPKLKWINPITQSA